MKFVPKLVDNDLLLGTNFIQKLQLVVTGPTLIAT
jgi:hypothetical protein